MPSESRGRCSVDDWTATAYVWVHPKLRAGNPRWRPRLAVEVLNLRAPARRRLGGPRQRGWTFIGKGVAMKLEAGKVALVTGAASGIGLALSERFARDGLHVVLAGVNQSTLASAAEKIGSLGVETLVVLPM